MMSILQSIQSLSLNLKIILSIILIAIVTFLHIIATPSIGIETLLSIDKIAHMIVFYFFGLWFFTFAKNVLDYFFIYSTLRICSEYGVHANEYLIQKFWMA